MPSADIFYVEASEEYVDAKMLVPPSDANDNPQFITNQSDLNNNNKYADSKVRAMWKQAADHTPPEGGFGALLLDATTAAVRAGGRTVGIYDKAKEVLRLHPHAIAIVVSGAEIAWSTGQPRSGRSKDGSMQENTFKGKAKNFSLILEDIDTHYRKRPVFVFGYSQLVRGISYRSRRRVPSHFILLYKDGMPLCRLVQAAGRAMGEQASALRANGFGCVKLLTQARDFDAIRAYPEFLNAIKQRMSSGMDLKEALQTKFGGEYNCFSGKTVGQKKLHLDDLVQQTLNFDVALPGQLIGATAEDEAMGTNGLGVTRAILEVLIDGFSHLVYAEDEAVTGKAILEELMTGNYDEFFEQEPKGRSGRPEQAEAIAALQIRNALKSMGDSNAYREAVVLKTGSKFYLNSVGVDRLPGRGADHRPHHQPAMLTQEQLVALMRKILRKSGNGLEVLKLSGVPLVAGWKERAYKHLAKLVHPDKWRQHGSELVELATKAFQAVQKARDQATGTVNDFVPDETDQAAVHAQREAAEVARLAAEPEDELDGAMYCGCSASSSAAEASSSSAPAFRSLGADSPEAPPAPARSASFVLSKRERLLQRAQQESQDSRAYEAAQEAAQKA